MLKTSLLLLPLVLSTPALAQTAPEDVVDVDPVATPTPDVVVAARVPQSAREVGQAVTVIDRDTIDQRQTVSVADLLAQTPGITVTRNGSLGGLTGVHIRGAEADQTLVVIDGIRVNDPSSTGGGFDFANLLSSSVDRIEVLRGPNSVPWGSQAIGGVVSITTLRPTADGVTARGRAEYGYHDSAFADAGLTLRRGGFSGAVSAGYLTSDGVSAAADGRERDGYRQYGGSARASLDVMDGIGVDLAGYYAHSGARLDGYPAPDYVLADDAEYSTAQEVYGYAGVHANLGDFHNRAAFTLADINRDNYDPASGAAPSFIGRGRSERYEYQGDWRASGAIRLVGGAERENSRFDDGSTFAKTGITSVYGEAIVTPLRQLTVTAGVRHDDHDDFGGHTTVGADAALTLATGTTLRASYGEGFKAPTLYQLFSFYGTPTLRPETAHNVDVGVSQSFLGGAGTVGATWFRRHTRNQIDFRSCVAAECAAQPYGLYDNIARTRAEGAEIEVALRPVEALTVSANYTYVHAENRSRGATFGNDLARRPRQSVTVNADYRLPFGLSIGGTVTHVGDSFDDAGNAVRLDGYVLAAARAELPIGERVALYGRVENAFDAHYQTVAGYGTYGRAAYGGVRVRLD